MTERGKPINGWRGWLIVASVAASAGAGGGLVWAPNDRYYGEQGRILEQRVAYLEDVVRSHDNQLAKLPPPELLERVTRLETIEELRKKGLLEE